MIHEHERSNKLYIKWIEDIQRRTYVWHHLYFCKDRCKMCPYFMKLGEENFDWECPYLDMDCIGIR